jgi:hypothetical protein
MYRGNTPANITMPGDFRRAAERLFPKDGLAKSQKLDLKTAAEFAKVLGIGIEYQRLFSLERNSAEFKIFLEQFQNNLDLLIRKTWVEKHDELRKNTLADNIPPFVMTIEQADYKKAIDNFSKILDELAYLLFGAQSDKEDFTEYTFRIDAQMGLFWWYSGRLETIKNLTDKNMDRGDKVLWAVLLLGLCYLTNF